MKYRRESVSTAPRSSRQIRSASSLEEAYGDCGSAGSDSVIGASPVSVDRRGGGVDQPGHTGLPGGGEDGGRSVDVVPPTAIELFDARRDGHEGGLVEHEPAAGDGPLQRSGIEHRALDQFDIQSGEVLRPTGAQVVEDPDRALIRPAGGPDGIR